MTNPFDTQISRLETQAIKWDMVHTPGGHIRRTERFSSGDVLPMWVADMDFPAAPPITKALQARLSHPVYGYTHTPDSYRAAVCDWMRRRQGWAPDPEWLLPTRGVVQALNLAVRAFSEPGDQIIVPSPVYYPFFTAVTGNGRELARSPLHEAADGSYTFDLAHIANLAAAPQTTLLLLCNPHNPGGRAWTPDELSDLAHLCAKHGVAVIADEIHADLTLPAHPFTPFHPIAQAADCSNVICSSASKAFNLAGLATSEVFLPTAQQRSKFRKELASAGVFGPDMLGPIATEAAYTQGSDWLDALLVYLETGLAIVREQLAPISDKLRLIPQEATYLAWIDCRGTGMSDEELATTFAEQARVYPESGPLYGPEGTGFIRLNFACPHHILTTALTRITQTFA